MIRWQASVVYRTDHGLKKFIHDIEELMDLHWIVELSGKHFDTVAEITIVRVGHLNGENLTVEQAARL